MDVKQQLMADLKVAMKDGDSIRRDTIRALRSAIRNVEIDTGHDVSDDEALAVLAKQAKQRRDSIEQFQQAGRTDLVQEEQQQLDIIETYLPQQLTDAEIEARARTTIAELGVADMTGMGKVMGRLSQEMKGVADGKRISNIVRSLLSAQ